jgi:hypothetical protein
MRHAKITPYVIGPAVFLALTGGVGLLPTQVVNLGACTDYCCGQMFAVCCISAVFVAFSLVCLICQLGKEGLVALSLSASVFLAGVVNWKFLDQDPLAAWLNWKAPFLKYDPCWRCSGIENHEQIYYETELDLYYGGGGGMAPPPEVMRYWESQR